MHPCIPASIHPSIDLHLVALIIKVSPAKSISKRASFFEILPKNLQNCPKLYPKSPMIAPKLPPKSYWILERTPNAPRNRFFTIFYDFWRVLGLPKSSSKRNNPEKSNWKSMFKKKTFFNIICSRFFIVLASKNEASITIFSDMFRERRSCENSQKPLKKQWFFMIFQGRSPQKSTKNRCQHEFEEHIAKNDPKIDFGVRV